MNSQTRIVVNVGDLCVFRQADSEKVLLGRIIQYSYLEGNKRERQYSSNFVDMSIDSFCKIGAYANYFAVVESEEEINDVVPFESLESVFTTGYISMTNFICIVNESSVVTSYRGDIAFAVKLDHLDSILPDWRRLISLKREFIPS